MQDFRSFLIVFNIAKKSNFGFLIRTANAFKAEVICVGKKKYSAGGAVAGTRHTKIHRFFTLNEAIDFVRSFDCKVAGIEIASDAKTIWSDPFDSPMAFMIGNEGEGLSPKQVGMCDFLITIPQYGDAVSLNVNVASAIVLSNYARWAQFPETNIKGNKFISEKWESDRAAREI